MSRKAVFIAYDVTKPLHELSTHYTMKSVAKHIGINQYYIRNTFNKLSKENLPLHKTFKNFVVFKSDITDLV